MFNKDFTFPDKELGQKGNLDYTWDFDIHWPVITLDRLENLTGVNLASQMGSTELAEVELKTIARLSKNYIMEKLKFDTKKKLEYLVAKDQDKLYEVLEFQVLIHEGGFASGTYVTMYNGDEKPTIGKAAEMYVDSSSLLTKEYNFYFDKQDYRKGY